MQKKGFSYAEAMVTMLIVAIIMVATTPILSQRKNVNRQRVWDWTDSTYSTYFGLSPKQSVYIGSQGTNDVQEDSRLIISAPERKTDSASGTALLPVYARFYDDSAHGNKLSAEFRAVVGDGQAGVVNGSLGIGTNALGKAYNESLDNNAFGTNALMNLTSGSQNTAVGSAALKNVTTGQNNTAIGFGACENIVAGNNNICIGNVSPSADASDTLYIGKITTQGQALIEGTGLADTTPMVNINGALYENRIRVATVQEVSDSRLKNIKGLSSAGLNAINKIVVKNFTYKNDKEQKPHVGVIAQELMKIFPNSVTKGEDGYYRINKDEMFYGMLNAIKELDKKFKKEDEKVSKLEKEVEALRAQNAQLAKQISEMQNLLKK